MAISYATYRGGKPIMIAFKDTGAAHVGGDVIVSGQGVQILHTDLAQSRQGAAAAGFGIYDFPKSTAGGSGAALAQFTQVVWDATNHIASPTLTAGKHLGIVVTPASADADTTVRVLHLPGPGGSSALTDSSGGVVGSTIASDIATQTFIVAVSLAKLANAQEICIDPGFAGKITAVNFRVGDTPATTAAKLATVTAEVAGVGVTGGAVALTSANCTPSGAQVAGSAITALNTFTSAQRIGVLVSAVTAFVEGNGYVELTVVNTDLAAAIASINAQI